MSKCSCTCLNCNEKITFIDEEFYCGKCDIYLRFDNENLSICLTHQFNLNTAYEVEI